MGGVAAATPAEEASAPPELASASAPAAVPESVPKGAPPELEPRPEPELAPEDDIGPELAPLVDEPAPEPELPAAVPASESAPELPTFGDMASVVHEGTEGEAQPWRVATPSAPSRPPRCTRAATMVAQGL